MVEYEKLQDRDIEKAKSLIREYITWLNIDLSFQDIDTEMDSFPEKYREPEGSFIVARDGEALVGCVGLKKLETGICEMKRLFVSDTHKSRGVGKRLVESILEEAKAKGYRKMRLDTLSRMQSAISLYTKFGFHPIDSYVFNPEEDVLYLEKEL
jgi:N-acetylglutamate synthase-like GNAT family acetyltransferase